MVGLDTNVLVRYLAQDDPKQSPQASRLIESLTPQAPGYVTMVALVELVWVLESCYDTPHGTIALTIERLLRTKSLVLEQAETVWQALRVFIAGHKDFADCLIARTAHAAGCAKVYTFDRAAIQKSGMHPVPGTSS